jgi:hypothetical protein
MRDTTENALQVLNHLRSGLYKPEDPKVEAMTRYFHKELRKLDELMAYVLLAVEENEAGIIEKDTKARLIELASEEFSQRESLKKLLYSKSYE